MVCVFFATVENISQHGKSWNVDVQRHDTQRSLDPPNTLLLTSLFVSLTILVLVPIWLTPSVPQAAPVSVQATGVSVQQTPNSYQVS